MVLTSEQIQIALDEVCPKYGAIKWALFGSYAHGTATERSDIDVLLEFKEKPKSYYEKMQISIELEELLGKRIDVIIAPMTRRSVFKPDENGAPMFVTSEERDERLIPVIIRSIARIRKKLENIDKESFEQNEDLGDAASMNIVKLNERVKSLSGDYFKRHPGFPRKEIMDMRNTLAHEYLAEDDEDIFETDIDYGEVWDFVHDILFPLEEYLTRGNS
jgi:predicted nucleotidyltransferase/uncharacterized protein with HEPN domain